MVCWTICFKTTQQMKFSKGTQWVLKDAVKPVLMLSEIKLFSCGETWISCIWFKYKVIWTWVNFSNSKPGPDIPFLHLLRAWNSMAWLCVGKVPTVGLTRCLIPGPTSPVHLPLASLSLLVMPHFLKLIHILSHASLMIRSQPHPFLQWGFTQVFLPRGNHS